MKVNKYLLATVAVLAAMVFDETSACEAGCLNAWGEVNCISNDFKSTRCCHHSDTNCMGNYRWCTRGIWNYDYLQLTCPMQDCPNGNNAISHKHNVFGSRI